MNKTDRMLAIVLELQRSRLLRAEDLAAIFETSVRTIYRDIQALCETGVPVVGAPGSGYSLMEGYFLPPVNFTAEEAVTLLIGTAFVEQKFDANYSARAQASRRKIEAVLPEPIRREAARTSESIKLINAGEAGAGGLGTDNIETLRQAILEERKIAFGYLKRLPDADGNRRSERTAAPYGLALVYGSWSLIAFCDLRQELRHFRLSRMSGLTLLEDRFKRPPDFDLGAYRPADDRDRYVRILADTRIADKVMESNNYFMEAADNHPDGLLVTLRVRQPEEVLQWVLGWGASVVVLEPESLRLRIREEAAKMIKRY